jgi:S1-C subfamily serine protease
MKKAFSPIVPYPLLAAFAFLCCLAASPEIARAASRTVTATRAPLELSVNIIGQREGQDRSLSEVPVRDGSVLQSHDNLRIHFSTNLDAYVYVLMFDARGIAQLLFPNSGSKSVARLKRKVEYSVPSGESWFWLDENTGNETICVVASLEPLDEMRRLLDRMEGSPKKEKDAVSGRLRQSVLSLQRANESADEGSAKSLRLGDGKTVQSVTDVVRGRVSAVRTVSFTHIDGRKLRSTAVTTGSGDKPEKREKLPGNGVPALKGAETAVAGVLEKISGGSPGETKIAALLERVRQNAALEETRGIGGTQIYRQLSPAVVLVATKEGMGSGSVIDKNGTVITNWHVIGNHNTTTVFFKPTNSRASKRKDAYTARVVKVDEVSDLALLRIENPPPGMPIARLGSMKGVCIGQEVHAIGHPDGETWSYTKGTISQIRPAYQWSYHDGSEHKASVIQTQTPINPGNSGGPLFDDNGEIIGVNSFSREGEGLNFAVSVDTVKTFLQAKGSRAVKKPPMPEWLKNSDFYDIHKDAAGKVDVVGVDTRRNGNIDFYVILDKNGAMDYIEFDRPDGSIELRMYDSDRDGTWKTYAFYNQENKLYLIGISDHGDGKIDRYTEP